MKVGIVGCGVMGAATARVLAKRGHEVTVHEQFDVGHKRGSSHGSTRIYRYSYPDATYVGMMKEAMGLWHEVEAESNTTLLNKVGGLDCGKLLDEHAAALGAHGIDYEILTPAQVRERWPSLRVPGEALFQAAGGYVRADLAWKAFADLARAAGAVTKKERVTALGEGTVETADGSATFDVVVVTAGGWARDLLATRGIDLPTRETRETVAFFRAPETLPTLVDWGDPSVYALPDPGRGLKVGEHIAGPTTNPDDEGRVNAASVERLKRWVSERYIGVDPEPQLAETCIYTNTTDEHFILERRGDIVIGSACSGHGFKFAPLIGKRLADLVES